jgi:hypothetical protein
MEMDRKILEALQEKEIFIGYMMLCRYLNGRGYIRHGCNAGYEGKFIPKSNPKNKRHPCKILCKDSRIYHSKVRYWCKKLEKDQRLYLEKVTYEDSKNPNSFVEPHKTGDIFVIIKKHN